MSTAKLTITDALPLPVDSDSEYRAMHDFIVWAVFGGKRPADGAKVSSINMFRIADVLDEFAQSAYHRRNCVLAAIYEANAPDPFQWFSENRPSLVRVEEEIYRIEGVNVALLQSAIAGNSCDDDDTVMTVFGNGVISFGALRDARFKGFDKSIGGSVWSINGCDCVFYAVKAIV